MVLPSNSATNAPGPSIRMQFPSLIDRVNDLQSMSYMAMITCASFPELASSDGGLDVVHVPLSGRSARERGRDTCSRRIGSARADAHVGADQGGRGIVRVHVLAECTKGVGGRSAPA